MFGALGTAVGGTSVVFVSEACVKKNIASKYRVNKRIEAVKNTRKIGKKDMKFNDALPKIEVDPETYEVTADGVLLSCQPAKVLPLAQRYYLM